MNKSFEWERYTQGRLGPVWWLVEKGLPFPAVATVRKLGDKWIAYSPDHFTPGFKTSASARSYVEKDMKKRLGFTDATFAKRS